MDSGDAMQLVIIVLLLALSAFFSSAETAYTTVNRIRIRTLSEEGNTAARRVERIINDSGKMLSAILIGNNIVNLSASSLTTVLATNVFGSGAVGAATGVLTLLVLLFGEISPKTMASVHAEKIALSYSFPIACLMWLLTPVIYIVNTLSRGFMLLFGIDPNRKNGNFTTNELKTIMEVSHEEGVLENEEKDIINNVFDFGDTQAKDIMVPRIDMVFVNINDTYDDLLKIYKEEMFTRLPVYEDTTDNVIGIVNMKDLILYEGKPEDFRIRDILREAHFTYEYKKISELMLEMKNYSVNFTIVLDEYGTTAGLITLEDLLEEIVGEIRDEYDSEEEELIQQVGDGEYVIEGSMKLDDINDALDLCLTSEDYDSIGGIIIGLLDHLPAVGESVTTPEGILLRVDSLDKNRIEKVHMYLNHKEAM
ncbi:MAG: hemolysin family protein [Lachnospiraceae bacterium]|nr:hemolysin family protein [Oscillospiraceae bacterium]MDY5648845.1 hemolysin family protein [Lachnospiraceae bacterium]